jgi:hypothetical protein
MISATHGRVANILRAAAPPLFVAFAAATLLRLPPAQNSFYPQCPIHEYLHLQCPGCGATRALAALLSGHLSEAIHFNALVTLLLPFFAVYVALCYYRFVRQKSLRLLHPSPAAIYAALALATVFTAIRNLPPHLF